MPSKFKKIAFYNLIVLLVAVQLVILVNYWYFVFKNISQASIRDTIAYQGKIVDANSVAITDGNYKMRFSIYDASTAGNLLWTESWDGTDQNSSLGGSQNSLVAITQGIFSAELNSLCGSWVGNCASNGGVDFNTNSLYLLVELDQDGNGAYEETFLPRKRFSSVAYSMNSAKLDGKSIGTSGASIPLLDGNNTFSGDNLFTVSASNNSGLIIQSLESAIVPLTDYLVQFKDSANALVGAVHPFGTIQGIPSAPNYPAFLAGPFPNSNPSNLIVGLSGSGALAINSDAGIIQLGSPSLNSYAKVGINTTNPTNTLDITINNSSDNGLVVKGAYLQTANLFDLRDSSDISLLSIGANGILTSAVPNGTAPISLTSSTLVTNLNADLLDGLSSSDYVLKAGDTMTGNLTLADASSAINSGSYTFQMRSGAQLAVTPPTGPSTADADIVSYWKFNEGVGSTSADEVGGRTLNVSTAAWGASGAFGYSGDQSLSFNGTSQYVEVAHDSGLTPSSITIYAWVKTTDSGTYRGIFDKGWNNPGGYVLQLRSGYASFDTQGPTGTFYTAMGTTNVADGEWHMIAGTFDSATQELKVYVDGSLEATTFSAELGSESLNAFIGGDGSSTFRLNGMIDNLVIYNTAHDSTKITADYNSGVTTGSGSGVGFSADTSNAFTSAEKLFSWKSAGVEKSYLNGAGELYVSSIIDSAGQKQVAFTGTASALNYLTITNGATGAAPVFGADGETNVNLTIKPKGTGSIKIPAQAAAGIPLIVMGAASQSANLQEWQNSTGTALLSVSSSGVLTSGVPQGTAPFAVESTTTVTNLSADLLDGHDSSYFASAGDTGGKLATTGGTMSGIINLSTVDRSTDTVTGNNTFTISDSAQNFAFQADSTTTDSDITTIYNLTGVSASLAQNITIHLRVVKGATAGARTHTIQIQIGGTAIYSVSTSSTTSADTVNNSRILRYNPKSAAWVTQTLN